ncbi:MAG: glycosyltransferase family 2 protein [Gemmatimonadetes bacterium]|nr:glycosyltransferase family 2 protein [Gemmatimonadota bacterium]
MIYICIPTHDEAPTIGLLLWKIRRVMDHFPRDYELLVLDDASTDGTQDVLAPYSRVLPLTVLRNTERAGYAASVERLIREVVARASHPRRDMMVVLQADFSEAPEDIPLLVKRIEGGADLVAATVADRGEVEPRSIRWARKGFPLLLKRAPLPEGIEDPLCGFRAYRVAILKRALAERGAARLITTEGWAANVELLLALAPFARRAEGTGVASRYDRRQRETRFRAWTTLVQLWEVSRRARHLPPLGEQSDAAA